MASKQRDTVNIHFATAVCKAASLLHAGFTFRAYGRVYHFKGIRDPLELQEAVTQVVYRSTRAPPQLSTHKTEVIGSIHRHAANYAANKLLWAQSELGAFCELPSTRTKSRKPPRSISEQELLLSRH